MAATLAAYLTPDQALQLQDTRPGSAAYEGILSQAASQAWTSAAAKNDTVSMGLAAYEGNLVNWRDGEPTVGPGPDPYQQLVNRNQLEIGALGPLFGGAGAATQVLGGTPQQVAAANEFGGEALTLAGATKWGGLGQSSAEPVTQENDLASVAGTGRPSWWQSEVDVGKDLGADWNAQISFKDGLAGC